MKLQAILPGQTFKAQAMRLCQTQVRGLKAGNWLGEAGFTCYQYSMAYVLYHFMPNLLLKVEERRRALYPTTGRDSLFYVSFLNHLYSRVLGSGMGFTYEDLAKNDGWKLSSESGVRRQQMFRIGELLDRRLSKDQFLLARRSYHGEAWAVNPYRPGHNRMSSKSGTYDLWNSGHFSRWYRETRRTLITDSYNLAGLDFSDFRNFGEGDPTRLAGRVEIEAVLAETPIEQIQREAEEIYYPKMVHLYSLR